MSLKHMDKDRRLPVLQHLERMRTSSRQEEGETTIMPKEVELSHSRPAQKTIEFIYPRCH